MLIPLVCTKCGGKLEVEKSQVFESGNAVIVLNDHKFKCPQCGIEYLPGEEIKHFLPKNTNISINGDSVGDIVIGYGNIINKNSSPPTYTTRVNTAEQEQPIKSQVEIAKTPNVLRESKVTPQHRRTLWFLIGMILLVGTILLFAIISLQQ